MCRNLHLCSFRACPEPDWRRTGVHNGLTFGWLVTVLLAFEVQFSTRPTERRHMTISGCSVHHGILGLICKFDHEISTANPPFDRLWSPGWRVSFVGSWLLLLGLFPCIEVSFFHRIYSTLFFSYFPLQFGQFLFWFKFTAELDRIFIHCKARHISYTFVFLPQPTIFQFCFLLPNLPAVLWDEITGERSTIARITPARSPASSCRISSGVAWRWVCLCSRVDIAKFHFYSLQMDAELSKNTFSGILVEFFWNFTGIFLEFYWNFSEFFGNFSEIFREFFREFFVQHHLFDLSFIKNSIFYVEYIIYFISNGNSRSIECFPFTFSIFCRSKRVDPLHATQKFHLQWNLSCLDSHIPRFPRFCVIPYESKVRISRMAPL